MAFNQENVLSKVREMHDCFKDGAGACNLDETNTSTVQNMKKKLCPKGQKQVHQVKGAERGESVTACMVIGAYGTVLPPVHIFPRKKYNSDFLINAYPGAVEMANAKGYMTKETFLEVLKHFIKCTGSTVENPTLLLLDNVGTHFSIDIFNLAKAYGVVIFTFPPHCTHRLQPLYVGFFGPFKLHYDQAVTIFLANNPACPPTIYRVAGFVKEVLYKAATPHNIIKCFETPGIVPFNRGVFTEIDFIMASVTAKPNPSQTSEIVDSNEQSVVEATAPINPAISVLEATDTNNTSNSASVSDAASVSDSATVSDAASVSDVVSSVTKPSYIGPKALRGLPKAKPSASTRKPRRKGKCMVVTDTPEKEEIRCGEEEQRKKKEQIQERKRKREERVAAAVQNNSSGKPKRNSKNQPRRINRILNYDLDSDEADDVDSVNSDVGGINETVVPLASNVKTFPPLERNPQEEDFVLVSF